MRLSGPSIGAALWLAFLVAGVGTALATVWVDPAGLLADHDPLAGYSAVFLFLWLLTSASAVATLLLVDPRPRDA